jgi:dTDP-4-amino-4,6-dideoxy-D-galactose acyltransferase
MGPHTKPIEKEILIFTKGGPIPEIGTGHLVRSVEIARKLVQLGGARITFLTSTKLELQSIVGDLRCNIYEYLENSSNPEYLLNLLATIKPEISIIDMLDMPENDLLLVRKESSVIFALDDTLEVNRKSIDIAVNSLINAKQADFFGLDYLVLPGQLEENFVRESSRKSIFINFGGYDHNRISVQIVRILSKLIESNIEFNVVSGNSEDTFAELQAISLGNVNIRMHRSPWNFYSILANSDAALVSGGLVMHTSVYLGVPTYVVSQYEHQELNAKKLSDHGAIVDFGRADIVDLSLAVDRLVRDVKNSSEISELARKGRLRIQENGLSRTSEILTIIEVLAWDSEFFKRRIARIYPTKLTESILSYSLRKALNAQIDCLFFLCDLNDPTSILLVEKAGFHLVDVRVTLTREVPSMLSTYQDSKIKSRIGNSEDLNELTEISEDFFQLSRYYFDGNFPKDKCKEFYQDWITKSVSGNFDDIVFVAEIGVEIVGFITCKRASRNLGRIGLVGVKKEKTGIGIGDVLMDAAFCWFMEQGVASIEVVTQGRNIAAQRLYQKNGFKAQKSELWYHKWMKPTEPHIDESGKS